MVSVRKATNKIIELAETGMISWRDIAMMSLKWMSEDSVADMLRANDVIFEEDEEDEG